MKIFKSVLIIIIVLGVTVAFFHTFSKTNTPVAVAPGTGATNTEVPPAVHAEQLCYLWSTPAGDKATINMDIRNQNVIGEFDWVPAEKDKKIGVFTGTIDSIDPAVALRTVNASWNTNAEGMKNTEQLIIKLMPTIAEPGFGEMKQTGDSAYVYADPSKVDYSLKLTKIVCADTTTKN